MRPSTSFPAIGTDERVPNRIVLQAYKAINRVRKRVTYTNTPGYSPPKPRDPPGTGGTIALDIETINLVPEPDLDFQTPEHWTVFCVPLGHRPTGATDIETEVLFRRGASACDELDLILRVVEWILARDPDELVTFNGRSYDVPILRHRAGVTAHECPGSTEVDAGLLFDQLPHVDLFESVKQIEERNVPLDEALDDHGIETQDVLLDDEPVTGADMPDLGMRILSDEGTPEEYQAVKQYARSDVEPLFELLDSLH